MKSTQKNWQNDRQPEIISAAYSTNSEWSSLWWSGLLTLIVVAVLLAATPAFAAARLTASADRTDISLEETFQLTVRYNSQVMLSEPDFSQLQKNFDILSNQRGNQFRSINGRSESWTQWTLTLAPKKTGTLLIPSFELKGSYSDAIEIHVSATPKSVPGQNKGKPFLQAELDPNDAYVQQQVIYKLKLYTQVNITDWSEPTLQVDNALVKKIDETQYRTTVNGQTYAVVEIDYALFPQKSGNLTIPPITWTVLAQTPSSYRDPFGRVSGQRLRLSTEAKTLTVKPKPADFNTDSWLPADNVVLSESWSGPLEKMKAGEPITRRISINAQGVLASQLPPLPFPKVKGLKYYPDQPQAEESLSNSGINTTKTESYAIVANTAGTYTLPAVTLNWWDNKTQSVKQATLPARTLQVAAAAVSNLPSAATAEDITSIPLVQDNLTDTSSVNTNTQPTTEATGSFWFYSACASSGLALLFALLWLRSRAQFTRETSPSGTTKGLRIDNSDEAQAFNRLRKAAGDCDLQTLRHLLQSWAQAYLDKKQQQLPEAQRISLQSGSSALMEVGKLSPTLAAASRELDQALYSPSQEKDYDSKALMQAIVDVRLHKNKTAASKELPPLYKHS